MTLLQRRPRPRSRSREVYRVYSEEEYLNGAGAEPASVGEWPAEVEPARHGSGERRLRRVAGLTMLVGAVGAVGATVVLNDARTHTSTKRGSGKLVAVARSRVVRPPVVTASRAAPPGPVVRRSFKSGRPLVRRTWHHHGGSGFRSLIDHSIEARRSVAIAVGYVPVPSAPANVPVPSAPAEAPPARPEPPAKRPEFGFER